MKILVTNYTFDASEKTVTLTDFNPVVLEQVLLITNVTDQIIIYNFADTAKGGTVTGASAVLTLEHDTTSMADGDDLQIWYDDVSLSGDTTDLATSALQLADGHNVTIDNAAGASAANVKGTVTANLSATDNAVLDDIALNQTDKSQHTKITDGTEEVAVNASLELQVIDDDGNTLLGTIDTDTGNIATDTSTIAGDTTSIDGKVTACNTGAIAGTVTANAGTNLNTSALATSAAQLADGHNVTVDNAAAGAAVNIQDGGNAITVDGTVTANLSAVDNAVLDTIKVDTEAIETAVEVMDDWDNTASDGASVSGDVAHSTTDAGEPVKIGAYATDYQPDSAGEQGRTEVTAAERVNIAANLRGEIVEGVKGGYTALTGIEQTYDGTPTQAASAAIECWQYRKGMLSYTIAETGTTTDIKFAVEMSCDNQVSWATYTNDFLGDLRYDDLSVNFVTPFEECVSFDVVGTHIRIRCTTITGGGSFTVSNAVLYMRN